MDYKAKQDELRSLRARVATLEVELAREDQTRSKHARRDPQTTQDIAYGLVLGLIGGAVSLLANVMGSIAAGQHPLELIRVYLTFPAGAAALDTTNAWALIAGCCLYLGGGMCGGVPFYLILRNRFGRSGPLRQFLGVTGMALCVWLVSYYGVLCWLQPALLGDAWIVEHVPGYVAILTHLAYGWTFWAADPHRRSIPLTTPRAMSIATL